MQSLMVISKKYFWDKDENPLAFGKIYIHQPGTTTPLPTFTTASGDVANPYPIILNGEGYASIYLNGPYDIVVDDSVDANIWTDDDVPTENAEEWQDCIVPTYISSTSFKIAGDFTTEYDVGRRARIDNDVATFAYSAVKTSSFAASETTIVLDDAIVLPAIVQACAAIIGRDSLPLDPDMSVQAKTTHNMASDADYSLTVSQAQNSIIEITDTGVLLTVPRNIVVPDSARTWIFINSTVQVLTVKTALGAGVPVDPGAVAHVFSDGTDVLNQEEPYTANSKATHDMASDADYSLTSAQAQSAIVEITDTTVVLTDARNIIVPDPVRVWVFKNSTGQDLTVKTAAGSGVEVTANETVSVYSDGSNVNAVAVQSAASATAASAGRLLEDKIIKATAPWNKPAGANYYHILVQGPGGGGGGADSNTTADGIGVTGASGGYDELIIDDTPGADVVVNGGFDSDTVWSKGTGWSIGSGVASCDGSQVANSDLIQTGILTIPTIYRITFTVSNYSAGNITPVSGSGGVGTAVNSNGTFTQDITTAGSTDFSLRADLDFVGSVDLVSAKPITVAATETATVGLGGIGGIASGGDGATGGTTSFGAHVSATGGEGGEGDISGNLSDDFPTPGAGIGGDLNIDGSSEGDSILGVAGKILTRAPSVTIPGVDGTGFGSGGSGAFCEQADTSGDVGGDGADGLIRVRSYS